MSEIEIPKRFEKILKTNQRLHGAVKTTTSKVADWLYVNKLAFFPEYTDHGTRHVQDVLNTADSIIRPEALDVLTAEDIYVLVLSILLHDCAMHISKNGLREIIENQVYSSSLFAYPIEDTFSKKWANFEVEVSKYTDNDWLKFFSDGSIVSFPKLKDDLTEKQHVIVGEFIRKYHARMAQVIARHGLPTGEAPVTFFESDLLHLNELAGFAARSHNISLRDAVEHVGQEHARITKNTHLAFIMGVLRIADYLQFEKKRTPKICFTTQAFCSPISIMEWKKQMAVINTHKTNNDEELLYVDAAPDDAITLEGIGGLIKGLQSELDAFWAVQGEMYSRFPDKRDLGIYIRRVRSSIDNPEDFVKKHYKNFHPQLLGLTTNDERLYPLLAGPLYGDRPLIGLRELLQNSIDACNERFAIDNAEDPFYEEVPYGVKVNFNKEDKTLSIIDEGNGMDIEIIEKYFLKIGSSYRYSAAWEDNFLKNEGAIVPRTGRFGIGVLAGFLLGEKITVHTRKVNQPEEKSLEFVMTPSSQKIQINYLRKENHGTSITIELNTAALTRFDQIEKDMSFSMPANYYHRQRRVEREEKEWRWYYLDSPKIEMNFLSAQSKLTFTKGTIKKDIFSKEWKAVNNTTGVKCFWRKSSTWLVYCNGVLIPNISSPSITLNGIVSKSYAHPYEVFFVDNDAVLPLNLQRNSFSTKDFFLSGKIKKEILHNHIYDSVHSLKKYSEKHNAINCKFRNSSKTFHSSDSTFAIFEDSATPLHPGFEFNPKTFYLIDYTKASIQRGLPQSVIKDLNYGYISLADVEKQASELRRALAYLIGAPPDSHYLFTLDSNPEPHCKFEGWHFVKKFDFEKLDSKEIETLKKAGCAIVEHPDSWISIAKGDNCDQIPPSILELFNQKCDLNCFMFSLFTIHNNHHLVSEFHTIWRELGLPNCINSALAKELILEIPQNNL